MRLATRLRQIRRLPAILAAAVLVACSGPQEPVTVVVDPDATTLHVGQTAVFTASVTGAAAVTWTADCGALEADGTSADYRAPWAPGTCTITATSIADPSVSASAAVTVTRVPDAVNLLPNPGFHTDLDGWAVVTDGADPRAVWDSEDVAGSGASGSALMSHPLAGVGALRIALRVCLEAEPSSTFTIGGAGRGVTNMEDGVSAQMWVVGRSDAGCAAGTDDPDSGSAYVVLTDAADGWSHGGDVVTTGPASVAVLVRVGIVKASSATADLALAHVDDLFLVLED